MQARRIGASEPTKLGQVTNVQAIHPHDISKCYVLTGDGAWLKTKFEERYAISPGVEPSALTILNSAHSPKGSCRRGIVAAFATNRSIESAGFANCLLDDALGTLCA